MSQGPEFDTQPSDLRAFHLSVQQRLLSVSYTDCHRARIEIDGGVAIYDDYLVAAGEHPEFVQGQQTLEEDLRRRPDDAEYYDCCERLAYDLLEAGKSMVSVSFFPESNRDSFVIFRLRDLITPDGQADEDYIWPTIARERWANPEPIDEEQPVIVVVGHDGRVREVSQELSSFPDLMRLSAYEQAQSPNAA